MKAGDEPYDPDMTVTEALELGLIAILDQATTGRTYKGPCNERMPFHVQSKTGMSVARCTRSKGHQGIHAVIIRSESVDEIRAREEAQRRQMDELRKKQAERARQAQADLTKAAQQMGTSMSKIAKDMADAVAKVEARMDSQVYGPTGVRGRKKDQFRDQMMRGRRR